ncbi:MAG TPA: hypothetical protein VK698_37105 [Kofleriaceae bacterium]|nr:hypothetical protein [Kofleriaceae bacterium]
MSSIEILGLASWVAESRSTTEEAIAAGVDVADYRGWKQRSVAPDERHPSDLAAEVLERALRRAGVSADELDLVLYTGVSRDYLPSWSMATEIAHRIGASCAGIDMTLGCLGILMGLEVARGWLQDPRRRAIAVVTAEKWAHTVDRTDLRLTAIWAHSDGAAAVVVGREGTPRSLARFRGVSVVSRPEMNGYVLVKYGGTRHPVAPAGCDPFSRSIRADPKRELFARYIADYERVIRDASAELDVPVERVVCNQVSPGVVSELEKRLGLAAQSIPRTGERHGHVGGADLVLGLEELLERGACAGPVLLASSCPFCFAAGAVSMMPDSPAS